MLRFWTLLGLICLPMLSDADIVGSVRFVDADTLDVGDVRIRLFAIDAPEQDQTCVTEHGVTFACGAWATEQVEKRFAGRTARCTPRDIDRYGRTVATCFVGGDDMGQIIVSEGWAFAYRRYGMDYDLDEKAAYVADRGLHDMRVQTPAQFRKRAAPSNSSSEGSCRIKGNISKNGKIYHTPGQEFYDRTSINTARGERWFCSAAEARSAGWRPARN